MAARPGVAGGRRRPPAAALHRPGHVPGHSRRRQSGLEARSGAARPSGAALLDSYGEERSAHVRELTTRIKAIGHVICERDPVAAEARDARILAEGNGKPRTITRQDIVPPLQRGLLAAAAHAANGTLFPQPWVRTAAGRQLLDAACGIGWRLVVDGGIALPRRRHRRSGARIWNAGHPYRGGGSARRHGWGRGRRRRALVRPPRLRGRDRPPGSLRVWRHHDAQSLAAMLSELSSRLQ